MTLYTVSSRASMVSGQPEDISPILANFDTIAAILNGNLDNSNVSAAAAISLTKLASSGQIGSSGVSIGANSITFGGDTSFYRSSSGVLKTDGFITAVTFNAYGVNSGYSAITAAITGEAQVRFIMAADGRMTWGGGAGANDTALYRSSTGILSTDGSFVVGNTVYSLGGGGLGFYYSAPTAAGYPFVSTKQGDAQNFFSIRYDGQLSWGPGGSGVPDTALYRNGIGSVRTDGQFYVGGNFVSFGAVYSQPAGAGGAFIYNPLTGGGTAFISQIQGAANATFTVSGTGTMGWGAGGASAVDVNLFRTAVGVLRTDSNFQIGGTVDVTGNVTVSALTGAFVARTKATISSPVLVCSVTGDTVDRWTLGADGRQSWGPGGGSGLDTDLFRSGAGILKTDGTFHVGVGLKFPDNTVQTTAAVAGGTDLGGKELAYSQITTSPAAVTATTSATAVTQIGPTSSITLDGVTTIMIELSMPYYITNQTNQTGFFELWEDSTAVGYMQVPLFNISLGLQPGLLTWRRTPSAGAHTYTIKAWVNGGNMQMGAGTGGASTPVPAYLRVRRVTS